MQQENEYDDVDLGSMGDGEYQTILTASPIIPECKQREQKQGAEDCKQQQEQQQQQQPKQHLQEKNKRKPEKVTSQQMDTDDDDANFDMGPKCKRKHIRLVSNEQDQKVLTASLLEKPDEGEDKVETGVVEEITELKEEEVKTKQDGQRDGGGECEGEAGGDEKAAEKKVEEVIKEEENGQDKVEAEAEEVDQDSTKMVDCAKEEKVEEVKNGQEIGDCALHKEVEGKKENNEEDVIGQRQQKYKGDEEGDEYVEGEDKIKEYSEEEDVEDEDGGDQDNDGGLSQRNEKEDQDEDSIIGEREQDEKEGDKGHVQAEKKRKEEETENEDCGEFGYEGDEEGGDEDDDGDDEDTEHVQNNNNNEDNDYCHNVDYNNNNDNDNDSDGGGDGDDDYDDDDDDDYDDNYDYDYDGDDDGENDDNGEDYDYENPEYNNNNDDSNNEDLDNIDFNENANRDNNTEDDTEDDTDDATEDDSYEYNDAPNNEDNEDVTNDCNNVNAHHQNLIKMRRKKFKLSRLSRSFSDSSVLRRKLREHEPCVIELTEYIQTFKQKIIKYEFKDGGKSNVVKFTLLSVLGYGANGQVYLVRKLGGRDTSILYAMKVLKKVNVFETEKGVEQVLAERKILEVLEQSQFVPHLHYAFQDETKLYLILDYVCGGEILSHLRRVRNFNEATASVYIAEVILALENLHNLNIIYRDLKLENLLMDHYGHIVLVDFGLSKLFSENVDHRAYTRCGTLEYMAPEVVEPYPNGYEFAADWWSVGVLTHELLTGASPFASTGKKRNEEEMQARILEGRPRLLPTLSENALDFIVKLFASNPTERLGCTNRNITEIKNHPFFCGINWDNLKNKRNKGPYTPDIGCDDDTRYFSKKFTDMIATLEPAPHPAEDRLFQGYTYIAPQHRLPGTTSLNANGSVNFHVEYCHEPVMNPPSPPDTLKLDTIINDGGVGKCYLAYYKNEKYAVKVLPKNMYRPAEVDALEECGGQNGHQAIVEYVTTYCMKSEIWILQEYIEGYDIADQIGKRSGVGFEETQCYAMFTQLVDAVQYIHGKGFIHGDLKPENLMLTGHDMKSIKLIDFGASCYFNRLDNWLDAPRYTLDYAPPEALQNANHCKYSTAYDVWCLGATFYFIYTGHQPFRKGYCDTDISFSVLKQRIMNTDITVNSSRWKNASSELVDLIFGCLQKDPQKRYTIKEVQEHAWFNFTLQKIEISKDLEHSDIESARSRRCN